MLIKKCFFQPVFLMIVQLENWIDFSNNIGGKKLLMGAMNLWLLYLTSLFFSLTTAGLNFLISSQRKPIKTTVILVAIA
jgi:hypothetical protein